MRSVLLGKCEPFQDILVGYLDLCHLTFEENSHQGQNFANTNIEAISEPLQGEQMKKQESLPQGDTERDI